jgi:hypothetical protein
MPWLIERMKRSKQTSDKAAECHAANTGRRVSPRDRILFDLAGFANLMTPRLTGQSKHSHLRLGYKIRRAYMEGREERLKELLEPIWAEAIGQFGDPEKLGYPHARSVEPSGPEDDPMTILSFRPGTAVGVPGVPEWSVSPRALIEQVWAARRLLWRLALEQRPREKNLLDQSWTFPLYASPNLWHTGRSIMKPLRTTSQYRAWYRKRRNTKSPIPFPLQPRARLIFPGDGRARLLNTDLSSMLVELLFEKPSRADRPTVNDISKLRICGAPYRRTRSRCCRLYVALTKNQKDCSLKCRDLRLHTQKRAEGKWT